MQPTIGVAIITYRARHLLEGCIAPLRRSSLRPDILVVNSSSNDGTVEEALRLGADILIVPRASFDHGATREAARRRLGTDIVVMLTPDAHAASDDMLERLTRPLIEGVAAVAYARQLPRRGAGQLERFARGFSYPSESELRNKHDYARLGASTHFCSNACAAWRNDALDRIGGFAPTLVSEETIATCKLLGQGETIAYVADACVRHSHATSLVGDFRRQFDVGFTRAARADLLLAGGADERRGLAYLKSLLAHLRREQPWLLPYALLHTAARYLGYRAGMLGHRLPRLVSARLSSQDFYWQSGREVSNP